MTPSETLGIIDHVLERGERGDPDLSNPLLCDAEVPED